jgi:hypothetical protein
MDLQPSQLAVGKLGYPGAFGMLRSQVQILAARLNTGSG